MMTGFHITAPHRPPSPTAAPTSDVTPGKHYDVINRQHQQSTTLRRACRFAGPGGFPAVEFTGIQCTTQTQTVAM